LNKKPIGIRHGFFELGGDSIRILRLAGQFKTKLGLDVAIADIYKNNTVEELARFISENQATIKQRGNALQQATEAMQEKGGAIRGSKTLYVPDITGAQR